MASLILRGDLARVTAVLVSHFLPDLVLINASLNCWSWESLYVRESLHLATLNSSTTEDRGSWSWPDLMYVEPSLHPLNWCYRTSYRVWRPELSILINHSSFYLVFGAGDAILVWQGIIVPPSKATKCETIHRCHMLTNVLKSFVLWHHVQPAKH